MYFTPANSESAAQRADLACWLVEEAVAILRAPDCAGSIVECRGLDTHETPLSPTRQRQINAILCESDEPAINSIPSLHRAELDWLNNYDVCKFPITLVARLTDSTQRDIRRQISKAISWLRLDADGLLFGTWAPPTPEEIEADRAWREKKDRRTAEMLEML